MPFARRVFHPPHTPPPNPRKPMGTTPPIRAPPTRVAGYTAGALPAANQVVGLSPLAATTLTGRQAYESTYNGSFEIQHTIGFSTVLQVAYVMNLQRHAAVSAATNAVTSLG